MVSLEQNHYPTETQEEFHCSDPIYNRPGVTASANTSPECVYFFTTEDGERWDLPLKNRFIQGPTAATWCFLANLDTVLREKWEAGIKLPRLDYSEDQFVKLRIFFFLLIPPSAGNYQLCWEGVADSSLEVSMSERVIYSL